MSALATGAAAVTRLAYLADPTDVGDETHKGGPFAILVVAVLCVVCFFLFRSMSKHLRRVRDDFPDGAPTDAAGAAPADPTAGDSGTDDGAAPPSTAPPAPGSTRPAPRSSAPRSRTGADHPAGR